MTFIEWILIALIFLLVVFFGYAGVTGSFFFDHQSKDDDS